MQVLVLEPEPYTALAIEGEIKREGHEVIHATRLEEVLELCRVHSAELVFIDVDEFDATVVRTVLGQLSSQLGLLVVLLTTATTLSTELRPYALGVLSKPSRLNTSRAPSQ